jgi:ribonuclease P protein component
MFTFCKDEKLCSKKLIDKVLSEGASFLNYPYRISFLETDFESAFPCQVLFIVSKKRFKKANMRNKIKRLMRETYRINKNLLYEWLKNNDKRVILAINYIGEDVMPFNEQSLKMAKVFDKLGQKIVERQEPDIKQ